MTSSLVVDFASEEKVLEAAEDDMVGISKLEDLFDVCGSLVELLPEVGGVSTEEILLDAERILIGTNEDDDEEWVRIAGDVC